MNGRPIRILCTIRFGKTLGWVRTVAKIFNFVTEDKFHLQFSQNMTRGHGLSYPNQSAKIEHFISVWIINQSCGWKTGDSSFIYTQRNSKKMNYLAKRLHKKDA